MVCYYHLEQTMKCHPFNIDIPGIPTATKRPAAIHKFPGLLHVFLYSIAPSQIYSNLLMSVKGKYVCNVQYFPAGLK
jgi:hypothetical protein